MRSRRPPPPPDSTHAINSRKGLLGFFSAGGSDHVSDQGLAEVGAFIQCGWAPLAWLDCHSGGFWVAARWAGLTTGWLWRGVHGGYNGCCAVHTNSCLDRSPRPVAHVLLLLALFLQAARYHEAVRPLEGRMKIPQPSTTAPRGAKFTG